MKRVVGLMALLNLIFAGGHAMASEDALFKLPPETTESRWISFENPTGEKGAGGKANKGAKGAAFEPVAPGETKVLMDIQGSGTIHRMWVTMRDRTPKSLRGFVLRMYWDGAEEPAVEAPFGDFFGAIHGETIAFESELFSNPEGRSFNCFVPMPFRTGAKITFTNESDKEQPQIFYDVAYTLNDGHEADVAYFHAHWRRVRWTEVGQDFEILPKVAGKGRFLGTHIGILNYPPNDGWWGEGEVKMYVDGDTDFPTIIGTGTEDYVGTAYGQGEFANRFQGSLIVDDKRKKYAFYRYHVPDPVYFHDDIRVTIQQMGGSTKTTVEKMLASGVEIQPVSVHGDDTGFVPLIELGKDLSDPDLPDGWTNMYQQQDVSAVAFFYLDTPTNGLPPIASLEARTEGI